MITQVHGPEFFRWCRLASGPRNFGKKKSYSRTDLKKNHIFKGTDTPVFQKKCWGEKPLMVFYDLYFLGLILI
jgi:hypothetical protein